MKDWTVNNNTTKSSTYVIEGGTDKLLRSLDKDVGTVSTKNDSITIILSNGIQININEEKKTINISTKV